MGMSDGTFLFSIICVYDVSWQDTEESEETF